MSKLVLYLFFLPGFTTLISAQTGSQGADSNNVTVKSAIALAAQKIQV
ncbi:MAG: hypothetical protein IPJ75_10150 [Ignavibacteriales bacterium]|nr:hypothetical protein [Ignavibacteriales bacterium]